MMLVAKLRGLGEEKWEILTKPCLDWCCCVFFSLNFVPLNKSVSKKQHEGMKDSFVVVETPESCGSLKLTDCWRNKNHIAFIPVLHPQNSNQNVDLLFFEKKHFLMWRAWCFTTFYLETILDIVFFSEFLRGRNSCYIGACHNRAASQRHDFGTRIPVDWAFNSI